MGTLKGAVAAEAPEPAPVPQEATRYARSPLVSVKLAPLAVAGDHEKTARAHV